MIKSETYQGIAGLNYIQDSELAFSTIYVVKREGTQHDKFVSGSNNRTYIADLSIGKISFPIVFALGGEKVFVLYKTGSGAEPEVPPGVCVPVAIPTTTLNHGVKDFPYSQTIILTGSQPFVLNVTDAPGWLAITNSTNQINLTGTPDTEGPVTVAFNVSNTCGSDSLSQSITVFPPFANLTIINATAPGTFIASVTDIPHYRLTGSYPLAVGGTVQAVHGDYTGVIGVQVSLSGFSRTLTLRKNSIVIQSIPVSSIGNSSHVFDSQSYLSTDDIQILFS